MPTIYDELTNATRVTPRASEDGAAFAKRLALAVDKLKDDEWQALSEEAQKWANEAITAVDKKDAPPALPGMPDVDAAEDPAEEPNPEDEPDAEDVEAAADDDEDEEPAPRKNGGKKAWTAERKPDDAEDAVPAPKAKKAKAAKASPKQPKSAGPKAGADDAKPKPKKTAAAKKKAPGPAPAKKERAVSGDARPGSKRAKLIEMLQRKKGATIAEIGEELGWQAHTTRAAISVQVRAAGHSVASADEGSRGRVYRIEA